ncbi:putative polygalacturonase [Dendrobium catenatum]|uniref:Putative polygalacturonase n=1 Tax=Dendrobium catenatum TaxID=906689 RepID=A0A2I0X7P5_9ASPA|nr:putative polygalacturonase [Dendrobium catenatum]
MDLGSNWSSFTSSAKRMEGSATSEEDDGRLLALWTLVSLLTACGDVSAAEAGRRDYVAELTEFGGVGDGVTSNTKAFLYAVANLSRRASGGCGGGAMLVVPAGRWLTDSCSNVIIEDNFIISGDDCVAIKSGWDEYGIRVGIPSEQITVRRLTCISPTSAVIAIGSEMSGGVRQIFAENITAINSESALRIKTAVGRGGFVRDVFVQGMTLHTMKYVLWFAVSYGNHPDDGWDPAALPEIENKYW